jgi:hypothetical protein
MVGIVGYKIHRIDQATRPLCPNSESRGPGRLIPRTFQDRRRRSSTCCEVRRRTTHRDASAFKWDGSAPQPKQRACRSTPFGVPATASPLLPPAPCLGGTAGRYAGRQATGPCASAARAIPVATWVPPPSRRLDTCDRGVQAPRTGVLNNPARVYHNQSPQLRSGTSSCCRRTKARARSEQEVHGSALAPSGLNSSAAPDAAFDCRR